MSETQAKIRSWRVGVATLIALGLTCAGGAQAQDCPSLLGLFQQGRSDVEIARRMGLTTNDVAFCRSQLQRPIVVGPEGAPPVGAVGPVPRGAAGPAPRGAAGPPPLGAAGAPPVGREVKRLP